MPREIVLATKRIGLILLLVILLKPGLLSHDHPHEHALNEIGLSFGLVQMHPEKETAAGLHLHFLRRFGDEGPARFFGLGLGFETIFSHHRHYNPMITIGIFPWRSLVITISPGVLIAREDDETHRRFSLHMEMVYEFELGALEIGPAVGFSRAGGESHLTIGCHIGKGF